MTKAVETRSTFQIRGTDSSPRIEGYFAVFGQNYELWPGATESIDQHAFDGCLDDDVRCLIDHDTRLVLGRTKSHTLKLRVDGHGLWGSVQINKDDTDAMNFYNRCKRGDVNQASFGFDILDEKVDKKANGEIHWTIKKVKLYEVSCCTFPAYTGTSIQARQKDIKKMQDLYTWRKNLRRRLAAAHKKLHERRS